MHINWTCLIYPKHTIMENQSNRLHAEINNALTKGAQLSNVVKRIIHFIEYAESNHDYAVSTDTLRCVMELARDEDYTKSPVKFDINEFNQFMDIATKFPNNEK